MNRKGGTRRKTRTKLRKSIRSKGKMSLSDYFRHYKEGDKVVLIPESSVNKGMPYRRFFGKTGIIQSKIGQCYNISIKDNNKKKIIVAHPIHLKRAK